jgi:hypothetical protein
MLVENMRAYFFNNMYLTGIHNGIQAGHALDQLWSSFTEHKGKLTKTAEAKFAMLREFSKNHKTWIVLKHGDHEALTDLYKFMAKQTKLPFTLFVEPGLNHCVTSVVVILPERLYDEVASAVGRAASKDGNLATTASRLPVTMMDEYFKREYTPWEIEFLRRKNACGLAA